MGNPCATRTHDWGTDPSTGRPRCQKCWLFGDHGSAERDAIIDEALRGWAEAEGVARDGKCQESPCPACEERKARFADLRARVEEARR